MISVLAVGVRPSCVIQEPVVESGKSGLIGQTAQSRAEVDFKHVTERARVLLVKATVSVQERFFITKGPF